MKAELLACGWTLATVGVTALFVAFVTAMTTSDESGILYPTAKGWCVALLVVAGICGLVGGTVLATLSALT